jgi:hypothetical protein
MRVLQIRYSGRAALLAGVALLTSSAHVAAADAAATPAGVEKIKDFVGVYAGKSTANSPEFVVTPEASDYLVTIDLGSMSKTLNGAGVSYEPAILKFKVFEQSDGAWRIEQTDLPPIVAHTRRADREVDTRLLASGVDSVVTIDPAISWLRGSQGKIDKATVVQKGQGIDQTIEIGGLTATSTGKATSDGVVSLDGHETLGPVSIDMTVDPSAADPKAGSDKGPVNIKMKAEKGDIGAKLDGLKIKPALDLWAFLVAHPGRSQLAGDESTLKTLAASVLTSQVTIFEEGSTPRLSVFTTPGEFVMDGLKASVSLASAGPASRFEEHIAVAALTLPPNLAPPMYHDLVPTSFDVGFKVSGFDVAAAGTEALADLHLSGDGPPISKDDKAKVGAKLIGSGPVVIDIAPSHVLAPGLDISFEGKVTYAKGKPTGAITLHAKNFDNTVSALKAMGPDAEKQMVPVVAMAKGLAKNDPDGVLTWVGEVGADGIMKVNGLPLGKAPF